MESKILELLESFLVNDEFDYIPERSIPEIVASILRLINEEQSGA